MSYQYCDRIYGYSAQSAYTTLLFCQTCQPGYANYRDSSALRTIAQVQRLRRTTGDARLYNLNSPYPLGAKFLPMGVASNGPTSPGLHATWDYFRTLVLHAAFDMPHRCESMWTAALDWGAWGPTPMQVWSDPGFDAVETLHLAIKDVEAQVFKNGIARLPGGQWEFGLDPINSISALDTGPPQFGLPIKHLTWPTLRDALKALNDFIKDRKLAHHVRGLQFGINSAHLGQVGKGAFG
ncbi:MAG: hypothetical protein Q9186_004615 [Xanthomendoza sp. 1 TL-2023]